MEQVVETESLGFDSTRSRLNWCKLYQLVREKTSSKKNRRSYNL